MKDTLNKQSFCWECGRKLIFPYYTNYVDPIGNTHKVHKKCAVNAKKFKEVMTYGKEVPTLNGVPVIHYMDHVLKDE